MAGSRADIRIGRSGARGREKIPDDCLDLLRLCEQGLHGGFRLGREPKLFFLHEEKLQLGMHENDGTGHGVLKAFYNGPQGSKVALASVLLPQQPAQGETEQQEQQAVEEHCWLGPYQLHPETRFFHARMHLGIDGSCA